MRRTLWKHFSAMFLCYLIDSTLNAYLLPVTASHNLIIVAAGSLMMFSLLCLTFESKSDLIFFAVICSFYYCVVYANTMPLYILIYLLIAFICSYLMKQENLSYIEYMLLSLCAVTLKEFMMYTLMRFTGHTVMSISYYIIHRYLPTMLVNLVLGIIIYQIYLHGHFKTTRIDYTAYDQHKIY